MVPTATGPCSRTEVTPVFHSGHRVGSASTAHTSSVETAMNWVYVVVRAIPPTLAPTRPDQYVRIITHPRTKTNGT
ncbi:hypothetical protein GCM10009764_01460 [Nocardia ninae]|uniref:Uncharacterized protein n=1 Tax=Nocardia ninae NBRC 108245 TaxID=1210091 RepID=A0A511MSY6_9NOCA|nr:hypothetical protein NN4_80700 [Nocardia ninae NBRC 108245]